MGKKRKRNKTNRNVWKECKRINVCITYRRWEKAVGIHPCFDIVMFSWHRKGKKSQSHHCNMLEPSTDLLNLLCHFIGHSSQTYTRFHYQHRGIAVVQFPELFKKKQVVFWRGKVGFECKARGLDGGSLHWICIISNLTSAVMVLIVITCFDQMF